MFLYESVLLFDPNLEEEKVDELVEKHSKFIVKNKGEILEVDKWGKRSLAYEINDFSRAHYVLITFNSKPEAIKLIERQYKLSEPTIRYLTIKKTSPFTPNPTATAATPNEG